MDNREKYIEKAVFVGVIKQNDDERQVLEYLDELEFLAETAGAEGKDASRRRAESHRCAA